jgi:hypothetical protein
MASISCNGSITPGGAASLTSGYTDGYSYGGPCGTVQDAYSEYRRCF